MEYGFNKFKHVVASYDGDNVMTFFDGVLVDIFKAEQDLVPAALVREFMAGRGGISGSYDNIRIYDHALSATEVAQLYEYESQPQPAADPRNATAIAQSVNGFIVGAEVTNGGSGYTSAPEITITGSGTGAVLQGIVSGGKVSSIEVLNPGSGYDSNSRIVIAAPPAQPSLLSISKEGVALKIVVRTQTGRSYQLQRTRGLFEWEDDGDGFIGTGAEVSFLREYFEPYRFWRVKVSEQ